MATLLPAGESPAPCFDDLDIPNDEKHKLEVIAEPDKFGGDGAEYCPDSDETSKVTVTVDLTRELSDNLQLLAKNVWRALAWSSSTQKNGGEFVLKPALDYEVWAAPASGGGTDGAISVASGVLTSPKKRRGITHPETYWATITSWEEKDEARTAISDTDANPVQKKYLEIVDKGKLFKAKWAGTGPQLDKDKISYWCFPSDSWRTMGDGSTYTKRDNLTGWDAAKDTAAYQTVMRKAIGFEGQTVGAAFDPNKYLGCWEDVYAAIIYLFREISSDPQPAMAANYKQGLFCSIPASKGVGPVKIENLLIPVSLFVPIAPTSEKYYSYFKSGFTDNDPSKTLQAKLRFSKQVSSNGLAVLEEIPAKYYEVADLSDTKATDLYPTKGGMYSEAITDDKKFKIFNFGRVVGFATIDVEINCTEPTQTPTEVPITPTPSPPPPVTVPPPPTQPTTTLKCADVPGGDSKWPAFSGNEGSSAAGQTSAISGFNAHRRTTTLRWYNQPMCAHFSGIKTIVVDWTPSLVHSNEL